MRLIGIYIDQQNNDPFVSKSLKGNGIRSIMEFIIPLINRM